MSDLWRRVLGSHRELRAWDLGFWGFRVQLQDLGVGGLNYSSECCVVSFQGDNAVTVDRLRLNTNDCVLRQHAARSGS